MPDKQMCEMTHVTVAAPIVGGYLFWSWKDLTQWWTVAANHFGSV